MAAQWLYKTLTIDSKECVRMFNRLTNRLPSTVSADDSSDAASFQGLAGVRKERLSDAGTIGIGPDGRREEGREPLPEASHREARAA